MSEPYPPDDPATAHVEITDRFALIPEALLYDPSIPAEAVRLYGVLRRHGSDPANCYPSLRRLGQLTGRAARSIPAWVRALEDAGWVERVPRVAPDGSPTSNGYRVHSTPRRAEQSGVRAEERGPSPVEQREPPAPESAPNESNGTRAMSNERELVLALVDAPLPGPLFDDFWSAYPYKRGSRAAAERAWLGALKVAKPSLIVEGARRLAADPNLPPKAEERFVRHGSTWLRDRGWEDGPLPARNGSPAPPIDTDRDAADGEWALVDGEWVAR